MANGLGEGGLRRAALLNALLELDGDHRIVDLEHLSPEQHVPVEEMKLSIVDVKCTDAGGRRYVVEMQVLNVEGFEKRVVYNTSKAYVMQLRNAEEYPRSATWSGVTICDFLLWPAAGAAAGADAEPLADAGAARRRRRAFAGAVCLPGAAQIRGRRRAGDDDRQVGLLFPRGGEPGRGAAGLAVRPYREALEVARTARFSPEEWDLYERAKMAEQDARGALMVARQEGIEEGLAGGELKARRETLLRPSGAQGRSTEKDAPVSRRARRR